MDIVEQLVSDGLWELFQDVAPEAPTRAQGGGRRRCDDRAVLAAILFVAASGCTWRQLPPVFGASWQTVHRRFAGWSKDRVWVKSHRVLLDRLGANGELDWTRCAIDSASVRAARGGPLTGPSPTDPGKLGSKIHVICDRSGLPISVGVTAANLHDSQALIPLMCGIPPIRSRYAPRRRRPAKLHADKGYDFDHLLVGPAVRACGQAVVGRPVAPVIWSQIAKRTVISARGPRTVISPPGNANGP